MEDKKMELKKTLLKNLLKTLDDGEGDKIKGGKTASIEVMSIGKPEMVEEEDETEESECGTEEESMEDTGEVEDDSDILEKLKKLLGE